MAKQIKIGDAVAGLAKALGIRHCPKCERRRLILNEIQKLGIRETIKRMKAVGKDESRGEDEYLKEIINKLNNCCKD